MELDVLFRGVCRVSVLVMCSLACGQEGVPVRCIYTETSRLVKAGERFPAGAALQLVERVSKRPLAPGFHVSADANISFDGQRVLFSGKQKPGDPWQIWDILECGGAH